MIKELHLAAQYLAAAAISFLDKKEDDSQTNLAWSEETNTLSTRSLSENGDILRLNFNSFSLEWSTNHQSKIVLPLAYKAHAEILDWIEEKVNTSDFDKAYQYSFHYDLGYNIDMNNYTFPEANIDNLKQLSSLYSIAQSAISKALRQNDLKSEIRVWPHHFDLGAYVAINDKLDLGMGLAIPDTSMVDFYYYMSGYQGENSVETKEFKPLTYGKWQKGEWKAATLNASGIERTIALQFLNESIITYCQ